MHDSFTTPPARRYARRSPYSPEDAHARRRHSRALVLGKVERRDDLSGSEDKRRACGRRFLAPGVLRGVSRALSRRCQSRGPTLAKGQGLPPASCDLPARPPSPAVSRPMRKPPSSGTKWAPAAPRRRGTGVRPNGMHGRLPWLPEGKMGGLDVSKPPSSRQGCGPVGDAANAHQPRFELADTVPWSSTAST